MVATSSRSRIAPTRYFSIVSSLLHNRLWVLLNLFLSVEEKADWRFGNSCAVSDFLRYINGDGTVASFASFHRAIAVAEFKHDIIEALKPDIRKHEPANAVMDFSATFAHLVWHFAPF